MKEYGHEYAEHWFYTPTLVDNAGGLNIIRAGQNKAKPNYQIGPRFIPYFSLHFVLAGRGTYVDEGKKYTIQSEDIFCLYSNHTHSYYTSEELPLEMAWVAFDGRQALSILKMLGITEEKTCLHGILTTLSRDTLQRLIQLFQVYEENMYFKKISLIYELFDQLYEEVRKKHIIQPTTEENWLNKGKNFIDIYYSEGISVADVAKYVGINRTHFSNTFTTKLGISPHQYIRKKVMNRAAQLLSETPNNISEIALSLYYSDIYSFSRSFKNFFGITPTRYREQNNNLIKKE
ncbi:hypothetical protein ACA30_04115 [Virgibacillus soli]|uniref:AraC family transcriptional regulator n=1 Tax=Lederbergia galactosidilytica TaxID=217031 RepID=UPI0007159833|nr:AraC family transcriptional regulator [Lederbergia galactosidilytica]KRG15776.1 hypothetical protein ACA30_04115 [Virgibacillus soli]MBP1915447.1 AraC-like DNA-binding protein [Lederbergia galactosidilytica]